MTFPATANREGLTAFLPAPAATRIAEAVLQMLRECGLPADVVRIVTGERVTPA